LSSNRNATRKDKAYSQLATDFTSQIDVDNPKSLIDDDDNDDDAGRNVAVEVMLNDLGNAIELKINSSKSHNASDIILKYLFQHTEKVLFGSKGSIVGTIGRSLNSSEEDSHIFWLDIAVEILKKLKLEKDSEVLSNKKSSVGEKTKKIIEYHQMQNALRSLGACKIVTRVISSISSWFEETRANVVKSIHKHAILVGVYLLEDTNIDTQV